MLSSMRLMSYSPGLAKICRKMLTSGYMNMMRLMSAVPGAHPAGALRASKFAPGEFV